MSKRLLSFVGLLGLLVLSSAGHAQIQAIPYQATTAMTPRSGYYPIAKIHDGHGKVATETDNGFASLSGSGTIVMRFEECATLQRFQLWNNVNRTDGGVKTFNLRLIDKYNFQLKLVSGLMPPNAGPNGTDPPVFQVPLGNTACVHTVEMDIVNSFGGAAEIREIEMVGAVQGEAGRCCRHSPPRP